MIKFIIRKLARSAQNISDYFRQKRGNRLMMSHALNLPHKTQTIYQR